DQGPRLVALALDAATRYLRELASDTSVTQALVHQYTNSADLRSFFQSRVAASAPRGSDPAAAFATTILTLPQDAAGQQVGRLLRGLAPGLMVVGAKVLDEMLILTEHRVAPAADPAPTGVAHPSAHA